MKKIMKKMMAFILIMAMCAGMWNLPGIVNATESQSVGTGTEQDPMQTGALTLANASGTTGGGYLCFNAANEMAFNWGDHLTAVSGKGAFLRNGEKFAPTFYAITEGNGFYFRIGPDSGMSDVAKGDEIRVFGEFMINSSAGSDKSNVGKYIKITPTTVRCTNVEWKEAESKWFTTWELISSAEDISKEEESYLSVSDFGTSSSWAGSVTPALNNSSEENAANVTDGTNTIFGKTFIAHMSATKTTDTTGYEGVFYGTTGSWNGICVKMQGIGANQNKVSVRVTSVDTADIGTAVEMTDEEMATGDWIQIKLSEKDASNHCYLTVTYGDYTLVDNYYFDASNLKSRVHQRADVNEIAISIKNITVEDRLKRMMDKAPEITAIDFGMSDGTYTTTQTGNLRETINGKKLVIDCGRLTSSDEAKLYYGSSWFQMRSDGCVVHYLRNTATSLSSRWPGATFEKPMRLEIYTEYVDLDDDGIHDDARTIYKINGDIIPITNASYVDESGYWFNHIDALYSVGYTLQLTPNNNTHSYWIQSVNTHASSTLADGVLTISGEGKVVPSVINKVVTDASQVTEIRFEEGITEVVSGVFNKYTSLQTVTYADSVTSVSDSAFTECATGVKIISPTGYAFSGGLVNPVHVSNFTFTELDINRSKETEDGLTIELKPSIVIKGTANEGNLSATTYLGLLAEIDGTATEVEFRKTSYGTLACDIPKQSLPTKETYTIIFKNGVMEDNDDDKVVCMGLKEDYTVYVNSAGLSGTGYVTDHGVVTLKSRTESAGQREVYFDVTNDSFPHRDIGDDATWISLEPIDENSGVFLNGRKIHCTLKKAFSTVYYLHLGGSAYSYQAGDTLIEQKAQMGDYLTVYGKFRHGDHVVEFAPFTYRSLGGSGAQSWEVVEPTNNKIFYGEQIIDLDTTGVGYTVLEGLADAVVTDGKVQTTYTDNTALYIPGDYTVTRTVNGVAYENSVVLYHKGDVNTDDVLNVKDLVAMLRYQKDASSYGKAAAQAANSVGDNSNTQMQTLREMLVATTVSKDGTELPMELVGQQLGKGDITWTDANETPTYITSVSVTDNGTTVFGMADANNGYSSSEVQKDAFDDYGYDYIIDLNATRDLKILQLTDTQIIERENGRIVYNSIGEEVGNRKSDTPSYETRSNIEAILTGYMDQVVKDTAPDLILLTGDNIMGEFDDAGSELQNLINKMDSYGILWAPIFGNHDNESLIGVTAQCQMFNDSQYCLFNRRHEVGGNGNYTIGLAQNGVIQRSVIMMDSNYTGLAVSKNLGHYREYPELDQLNNCTTEGFTYVQNEWYRDIAIRINTVAGRTVPSFLVYHIPTKDVYYAELAAGYITENDNANYTITEENRAQPGDSGVKTASNAGCYTNATLLGYMNEVGTDGAFFGHLHSNSTSIFYGGVRWTFGVKTGCYDFHSANEVGGTLITLSADDYISFAITPKTYDCPTQADDGFECSRH